MRGTALDVYVQRTLRRLYGVRGHRDVVVHVDRPDPDRLADPDDPPLDGSLVGLAVERDLAPCQGASQSAVHSASDGGDDVIERRGDRRPLFGAVILAQRSLDAVDDGFGHFTEIRVAVTALVLETRARDVLEVVGHGSGLLTSLGHAVRRAGFATTKAAVRWGRRPST